MKKHKKILVILLVIAVIVSTIVTIANWLAIYNQKESFISWLKIAKLLSGVLLLSIFNIAYYTVKRLLKKEGYMYFEFALTATLLSFGFVLFFSLSFI